MAYTDLRSFLEAIEDDLLRVPEAIDPKYEIAALLSETQGGGEAVLCEKVTGHDGVRVVGNLLSSRARMAKALGTSEAELANTYLSCKDHCIKPVNYLGDAPVQQVVHLAPAEVSDLLPVLTHYAGDAAPFITCGVIFSKDPSNGRRAMGIHRMMVKGGNRLGVFLANPPLSKFHAMAEAENAPLEVAIALGVEPATLIASVVKVGEVGPDKLEIAGSLRGKPMELVRCKTVDVQVPATAEYVIEGRVLPGVREQEGPFGENTGYYFSNSSPVIEVTAITHRENPIYTALCPWTTDVDNLLSLAAGTELLWQVQGQMHGILDLELITGTCGFTAVIAVKDMPAAEVRRLITLTLGMDRRLKHVTVVNNDVDIRNPREVAWAVATRCQPARDTLILDRMEGYVIDPSVGADGSGSKMGIDATRGEGPEFDRVTIPEEAREKMQEMLFRLRVGRAN